MNKILEFYKKNTPICILGIVVVFVAIIASVVVITH